MNEKIGGKGIKKKQRKKKEGESERKMMKGKNC